MTTVYQRGIAKLVRHQTLNLAFVGSSPATPANLEISSLRLNGVGFIQLGIRNDELGIVITTQQK